LTPIDDTQISQTVWNMSITPPLSHPIVGEKPDEYEAAMKQKEESLSNFHEKYPQHNHYRIWWDEKNRKVHKYNSFGDR